jgi:arginyl-tRNA synthetase
MERGQFNTEQFLAPATGDDLWDLILMASSLDARVEQAVSSQEPAFIARYAFELAQQFNNFYHKHPILTEENTEKRAFLLRLTGLVHDNLETALGLMGIIAPEKM